MKFLLIFSFVAFTVTSYGQSLQDARNEWERGNFTRAGQYLHQAIKNNSERPEAWAYLMRLYASTGSGDLDTLTKAPATIQDAPYFLAAKGIVALAENDQSKATQLFDQAVAGTKGKDAGLMQMIADAHIESPYGNASYTLSLLAMAKKRDKKNASIRISEGMLFRKQHNGTEAYKSFMEAIDLNEKEAKAYYELGRVFLTQKNVELYTEYFTKAIDADPQFAPALYEMYEHYLYRDPAKAKHYFLQYTIHSEPGLQHDYAYADLLYLTKNYDSAIIQAKRLIASEQEKVQPRLYKMISYSMQEKGDTLGAFPYMADYFMREADSALVLKDFETMGSLFQAQSQFDSAGIYFEKALAMAGTLKDSVRFYNTLATNAKLSKDNVQEAFWRKQIYDRDPSASNIALFNWGISAYKAQDYSQADSAFAIYAEKYADQGHGYYWRARSNAAMDSALEKGLAIPYYRQLLDLAKEDSTDEGNRKWMKEALSYLGTYEANTEKDYSEAVEYFEELLMIDPGNEKVIESIGILKKGMLDRDTGSR